MIDKKVDLAELIGIERLTQSQKAIIDLGQSYEDQIYPLTLAQRATDGFQDLPGSNWQYQVKRYRTISDPGNFGTKTIIFFKDKTTGTVAVVKNYEVSKEQQGIGTYISLPDTLKQSGLFNPILWASEDHPIYLTEFVTGDENKDIINKHDLQTTALKASDFLITCAGNGVHLTDLTFGDGHNVMYIDKGFIIIDHGSYQVRPERSMGELIQAQVHNELFSLYEHILCGSKGISGDDGRMVFSEESVQRLYFLYHYVRELTRKEGIVSFNTPRVTAPLSKNTETIEITSMADLIDDLIAEGQKINRAGGTSYRDIDSYSSQKDFPIDERVALLQEMRKKIVEV